MVDSVSYKGTCTLSRLEKLMYDVAKYLTARRASLILLIAGAKEYLHKRAIHLVVVPHHPS